jgi:hypothetical protein
LGEGTRRLATHVTVHGLESTIEHLQQGGLPTESISLEEAAKSRAVAAPAEPLYSEPFEDYFAAWEAFVSDGEAPEAQGPRNIPRRSATTGERLETEVDFRMRVAGHLSEERGESALRRFFRVGQEAMGVPDPDIDEETMKAALYDMDRQAREAVEAFEAGELRPPDPARAIQREAFADAQARQATSPAAGGTRLPT